MLQLYSEPKGSSGFLATGLMKLLGSPAIEQHEILIRESVQNSWDARLKDKIPYFGVDVRKLGEYQKSVLVNEVLVDSGRTGPRISQFLQRYEDAWVLEISDRKTTGLTGHVDPRIATKDGEPRNFADLIYTFGATSENGATGGTYGYGKVAAFQSSDLGTVIYWTRCEHEGHLEYRLIASRLAHEVEHDGLGYTGRHLWGRLDPDANVLPLVGEDARMLGEKIFNRGFANEETGTSIMVLKPVMPTFETDTEESVSEIDSTAGLAERIRDSVLVNLWPKITPDPDGLVPMDIEVKYEGSKLEFGDPTIGLWRTWADALNRIRRHESGGAYRMGGDNFWEIRFRRQSPNQPLGFLHIGNFAISKGANIPMHTHFDRLFANKSGLYCRMRAPELVVDYVPLPGLIEEDSYFGGVFKVLDDEHANTSFAAAEGPTHTEWNGEAKGPAVRGMINMAKRRIAEYSNEYFSLLTPASSDSRQFNQKVANQLRYLVPVGSGRESATKPRARRAGARAKVLLPTLEDVSFVEIDEHGLQVQLATVKLPKAERPVPVYLKIERIGGGADFEIDSNQLQVEWLDHSDAIVDSGTRVRLKGESTYRARIATTAGYRLRINLKGE